MHTLFDRNLPALLLLLLLLESTDPRSLRASGSTTAPSASAPQSQPATIPTRQQKTRRRLLSAAAGETGGLAVTAGWGTASRALEQHCMSGARLELGIDLWVGSGKKKSTPIEPAGATLLGKRWARRQRRKAGHESGRDTSVGMVDWRRAFARGKHAVSTRSARDRLASSSRVRDVSSCRLLRATMTKPAVSVIEGKKARACVCGRESARARACQRWRGAKRWTRAGRTQKLSCLAATRFADDPFLYTTPDRHVKRGTSTQMAQITSYRRTGSPLSGSNEPPQPKPPAARRSQRGCPLALGRVATAGLTGAAPYAAPAVQFHPHGGQSDFVWLPARTPHGAYVW